MAEANLATQWCLLAFHRPGASSVLISFECSRRTLQRFPIKVVFPDAAAATCAYAHKSIETAHTALHSSNRMKKQLKPSAMMIGE